MPVMFILFFECFIHIKKYGCIFKLLVALHQTLVMSRHVEALDLNFTDNRLQHQLARVVRDVR